MTFTRASHPGQTLASRLGALLLPLAALLLSFLPLSASAQAPSQAETVSIFSKTYVAGMPASRTDSFTLPADVHPPYALRVQNGDGAGNFQVRQATIQVNQRVVVPMHKFPDSAASFQATIDLAAANTLHLTIPAARSRGGPGQFILTITGTRHLPTPVKLAPDPLGLITGGTGTLAATLSPAPAAAGALAAASSAPGVAAVPATVPYAAGQTTVGIPVSGVGPGSAQVSATLNGRSASAAVQVASRPGSLASLLPASLTLTQGAAGTLAATLSNAAATDQVISLSSTAPGVASVPASVTVPAGAVSVAVPVTAVSPGTAAIVASYSGSTAQSSITVVASQPTVVSLQPTTASITLGGSANLEVVLSAAPAVPTTVTLAATPAGIVSIPAAITVPAGATRAQFIAQAVAFGQAGVTASLNGSSANSVLAVVPVPAQLVDLAPAKASLSAGAGTAFTATLNAVQPGPIDISLAVDRPDLLQIPATVTVPAGQTSAAFTATGINSGDAVLTATLGGTRKASAIHIAPRPAQVVSLLPNPLPLQPGATGMLTAAIDVAQEADSTLRLTDDAPGIAAVPETVTIPAGSLSASIPVQGLAAGSATIGASLNGTTQAATVQVMQPAPGVTGLAPASVALAKGRPGQFSVTVSRAPAEPLTVALASSNPNVASVPASVTIPAGSLKADFPVATLAVGQTKVSASVNGTTQSATLTVAPAEVATLAIVPEAPTIHAQDSLFFTAIGSYTDGTTQDLTDQVSWTSSDPAVAGIISGGTAKTLAGGTTNIQATYSFTNAQGAPATVSQSTVLTVNAAANLALTAAATSLVTGQSTQVTVTSSTPAGPGGLTVTLAADSGGLGFPPSITVPVGQTSTTFTVTAAASGTVFLSASAPGRNPASVSFVIQTSFQITGLTPASGPVGARVTITGSGFDPVAGKNVVKFTGGSGAAGVVATVLEASATQLQVLVPLAAETGPFTLTNSRGTLTGPIFTVQHDQDFQLVASPASLPVLTGAAATAQVQLSSTGLSPYTGLATLKASGLPAGVSVQFGSIGISAGQAVPAIFRATAAAVPGEYPITITGEAGSGGSILQRSAAVTLRVQSGTGATGIKGRFVTPEGAGIAGIIVRADIDRTPQPQTTTDAAGNFLLTGLTAGTVTMRFDATPANPLYPIWPYNIQITEGQVAVMSDWVVNPPPAAEKFIPIANATQDQAVSDPRYPGFAVILPAGASIIGWDGVKKTRIAIERITPDRLPVPAPPFPFREAYQFYFGTPMGGIPSQPIPVTLPNVAELEPGESADIWYFDGSPMGGSGEWKLAGKGTVSADGKTVTSNPGTGIPRFCGVCGLASLSCPPPPNPPPPPPCPSEQAGKPVDLATGQEMPSSSGMSCHGLVPVETGMRYNPVDSFNNRAGTVASLGYGWTLDYDVAFLPFEGAQKRLVMPGSIHINFVDDGTGSYRPYDDPRMDGAVIRAASGGANEWDLIFKDGRRWHFKPFPGITGVIRGGPPTFVTEMYDPAGNALSITRLSNGRITAAGTPERNVRMTYGANGFVNEIKDTLGRTTKFTYTAPDATGDTRLASVTDPEGRVTGYTYVGDGEYPADPACPAPATLGKRIKSITHPGRAVPTVNDYGSGRRILRQTGYDGREFRFAYKLTGACVTHAASPGVRCTGLSCPDTDSWENHLAGWRFYGGRIVSTTVTRPDGSANTNIINTKGQSAQSIDAQGQARRREFDGANRVIQETDALGRVWKYQYDAQGNVTRSTDPLGRVTDKVYDGKWAKPTSITRYLNGAPVVQQTQYDPKHGKPVRFTDPLGNVTQLTYTARGQLANATDPLGQATTIDYNSAGDPVRRTDPLGGEVLLGYDAVGRPTQATDPLGYTTLTAYDGTDQVTQVTDPLGGQTRHAYDGAGRLASATNARGNAVTTYQYDGGDRITQRTDALGKASRNRYDSAGRLIEATDRRGQATRFAHDGQGRLTRIDFSDGTSQSRSYDAAGRLSEIAEPNNVQTFAYDAGDRVTQATTDTAAGRTRLSYEYDDLDRVVKRTLSVPGAALDVTQYQYDKAGRLTQITYASPTMGAAGQVTAYEWDAASRLTKKTLPNGLQVSYQYDAASRPTQIHYQQGNGTLVETLRYAYDAAGQVAMKSSGAESVGETPFTAQYDAADRMTQVTVGGASYGLTYDEAGNLVQKQNLADPADRTSYTWDARNRLAQLQGPAVTASFEYDAGGRRIARTVNGATTRYVYDGVQAIGEIGDGSLQATVLTGLNIDEAIARYTAQGRSVYLTDTLGSVIAQAGPGEGIRNWYAYSPYGETQKIGPDGGNPIQYTGRENDGTGLYYYRARYYDPVRKRFVSEDPIGLAGGMNVYAYVEGAPVSKLDPLGLATYICQRPLGGKPGAWAPPVLNHTYVCVGSDPSNMICGSTTASTNGIWPNVNKGSPGVPTTPDKDYYHPDACDKRWDEDSCIETCIENALKDPQRPWYAVGPLGEDCQEYTANIVETCERRCSRR